MSVTYWKYATGLQPAFVPVSTRSHARASGAAHTLPQAAAIKPQLKDFNHAVTIITLAIDSDIT